MDSGSPGTPGDAAGSAPLTTYTANPASGPMPSASPELAPHAVPALHVVLEPTLGCAGVSLGVTPRAVPQPRLHGAPEPARWAGPASAPHAASGPALCAGSRFLPWVAPSPARRHAPGLSPLPALCAGPEPRALRMTGPRAAFEAAARAAGRPVLRTVPRPGAVPVPWATCVLVAHTASGPMPRSASECPRHLGPAPDLAPRVVPAPGAAPRPVSDPRPCLGVRWV